ncbi:MAG: peptide deformylase [Eubacteriales bacterium]
MAILKILTEDRDGEFLRKTSKPVTEITPRILQLLDDMGDTLLKAEGVGLAAVQVGFLRRIYIIDAGVEEDRHEIIEFINPEIIAREGTQEEAEGCLSLPGQYGITSRPAKVTVRATDRTGKVFEYTATGLLGRCLCHEYDHLDGILYTDKAIRMLDPSEYE